MKHKLKVKYYIRYADDFVILSHNKPELINQLITIDSFLKDKLKLNLHPNKIIFKTFASGLDFLGWIHFPNYRVLRNTTKRRILHRLIRTNMPIQSLQLYLGLLKHGNTHKFLENYLMAFCG